MKLLIALITFCVFSVSAMAQDDQTKNKTQKPNDTEVTYCAKLRDGKVIVMQNKKELTIDVTLANGTTVKTDGTILKPDGTQINLKKGECADNNGNIMNPKGENKTSTDYSMPPK